MANSKWFQINLGLWACVILIALYFLVAPTWELIRNIIVGLIGADILYLLFAIPKETKKVFSSAIENNKANIITKIQTEIDNSKDEILKQQDDLPRKVLEILATENGSLMLKLDSVKNELSTRIQEMSKQIGEEVNTKLDLDSNELYTFFGLKDTCISSMFQDFRVYRADPNHSNENAVSFLWADTFYGNTINAKVNRDGDEAFLRVEFQSFSRESWGCNIGIRPQNQTASDLRGQQSLKYLVFQARIPEEAEQQSDLLRNVGIAVRIVNGKYQHWEYATAPKQYVHFQISEIGAWKTVCLNLNRKSMWWHFPDDGNPNISQEEINNADLSIISAVILKFGKYQPNSVGELGAGKGMIDIKRIEFSENRVN